MGTHIGTGGASKDRMEVFLYLLLGCKCRAWGMQDSHIFRDEFCHSCPEDRDTLASALWPPPKPGSCPWLPRAGRDGR